MEKSETLGALHTHTHTLCLQNELNKEFKKQGYNIKNVANILLFQKNLTCKKTNKLYIIYRNIKVDILKVRRKALQLEYENCSNIS